MAELNSISALLADSNLKAYYRLDNVSDSGPNGFTLTNNNSVTFPSGKFGNGADLGSSDTDKCLSINNDLGVTNGNCSISLWTQLNTEIAAGEYFFSIVADAGTNIFYLISYDYNGGTRRVRFCRGKSGVAANNVFGTVTLGTSSFHHLVITYDGANVEGWLNNVSLGTTGSTGNGSAGLSDKFVIGADLDLTTSSALAKIDDVAVFNRKLTSQEIGQLYAAGFSGTPMFFTTNGLAIN